METSQELLLKEITSLLEKADIPYMITGSLSVIFYGRPRASHDLDFIIEAKTADIPKIIKAFSALPDTFLVDNQMIKNAIINKNSFNILHLPSYLKLDFWLLKDNDFDIVRFKRKKRFKVFGQNMFFSTPEDTILIKLNWYQQSDIEKHLVDAAFVYQIQRKKLNSKYLTTWAKKLKVEKQLKLLPKIDLEQYY